MRQHSQCIQPASKTEYGKNVEEQEHHYAGGSRNGHTILKNNLMLSSKVEGFPDGSVAKNLPANAGDTGSTPGPGRSLEKEMATTQVFLPRKSREQRSLVGCRAWGCRRPGTTEQLKGINSKAEQARPLRFSNTTPKHAFSKVQAREHKET